MSNKIKNLSESQQEILRWLGRGHYIYYDERGKFRLSAQIVGTNTARVIKAGHGEGHMYRPTIEWFINNYLIICKVVNNRPHWYLNRNHSDPEWQEVINELKVQGILGIERDDHC